MSERKSYDLLVVGVGGQGTILASDVLAQVGLRAGYEVKKSEVHGMAQRGGSVSSHIRWGPRVYSPLIGRGQANIMVALERLEALRYLELMRPDGRVLINDYAIVPVTVTTGSAVYPTRETILDTLQQHKLEVTFVPAVAVAEELGNARANNVVILGALSRWFDVKEAIWQETIAERVPARYRELNLEAFARGRKLI